MALHNKSAQCVIKAQNLNDTDKLAAYLANQVVPGTVIVLDGDLGAGKTAFSTLFAKHLGVTDTVNSPTYTLIKEYVGRMPFYHMDVYRISLEEADELGLDDYFFGDGVTLVEWGSVIEDILPASYLHLVLEVTGETERRISVTGIGQPYEEWSMTLKQNGV